jgi:hypothetical protein
MEAMRALKRRLSNVVYQRMLADRQRREAAGPRGHSGTTIQSSVTDLTPDIGFSEPPTPTLRNFQKRLDIKGAMRVRPATRACHHADLNARDKFLGIGVEMHVPGPT